PRPHEAREPGLARGDVPLQQPAVDRALPDRALGCDLPDPDRALPRPVADDRAALLRLLPPHLRAAAAAPDGHRSTDRLAPSFGACTVEDAALAACRRAPRRRRPDRSRRGLLASGPDRLRSRPSCWPRSWSSSCAERAQP